MSDDEQSLPTEGPLPEETSDEGPESLQPPTWRLNAALFVATVISVFYTGAVVWGAGPVEGGVVATIRALPSGWPFAVPLLAILLTHEFGHFIAARLHGVDASLPFFIPLPSISPFGTMGAVINMRGRIRSRNALLDIGASGPLAGLAVAIPVLIVGLHQSPVLPNGEHGMQEGQCLLYAFLKRVVVGPIPDGYDVFLTPTALAGWAGLFVTMMNLVAVAQLDGGHIAYALFGPKQNQYGRVLHALLLVAFAGNVLRFFIPLARAHTWDTHHVLQAFGNTTFWLVWYGLIRVVMRVSGRDHPPTEPGELSSTRRVLAVLSLVLFVLLFMPTPWTSY